MEGHGQHKGYSGAFNWSTALVFYGDIYTTIASRNIPIQDTLRCDRTAIGVQT
jgi:hypothetical protein